MPHELKRFQLKEMTEAGSVKAVFATLGVVDHDGDIVMPGSITNGQPVRMSAYNHSSWGSEMPVGKGTISEVGNELIFDGQFFLDTEGGLETYKTVRNLGALGEWSFGFDVLEKDYSTDPANNQEVRRLKKMSVYEVSPVLLGAGIDTRTLAMKSKDAQSQTFEDHADATLEALSDFVKRAQSIAELRTKDGREPASKKNREGLKAIASELTKAAGELTRLAESDPEAKAKAANAEFAALFARIETQKIMEAQ